MDFPVVKGVSYFLAHVPGVVRHGSKPCRELPKGGESLLGAFLRSLRTYEEAKSYPPHQVFIGNLHPDDLWNVERPWYAHPAPGASRQGPYGEIMPEEEFYGFMKVSDEFNLLLLEEGFLARVRESLRGHPLLTAVDLARLEKGTPREAIEESIEQGLTLPVYLAPQQLVGCVLQAHDEDEALSARVMMENLACKASAALALRHLLSRGDGLAPEEVDYILNSGEEAVGDRYQRGGGNLAKAVGELSGCANASGADIKAFCCSPLHAIVIAAGLVQAGLYRNVAVIGGGSFAKLGMKFKGHLAKGMPLMEDVLAAVAILIGPDDGKNPLIRLDVVGKHNIGLGTLPQVLVQALVVEPLDRLGMRLTDVDKYALEMHNPEITEPAGSGDVPRNNYRLIAGMAAIRHEIEPTALEEFIAIHGMPGFSPTQGHIPAAIPFLGHAREAMLAGKMERAMFVAKGSLFLGRMTNLSDGMSFLLERNGRGMDVA
ncbi:MAG: glycine/sarcosine/betaine reductase complex component C subunit beta [Chloroflexi bacterium]|nr:glycine/sarcosine/betaine reductase complex component C subunit beta [Chloroflexota bacterium]MCL5075968.1 glycine/sarcosine/betaine reductase complex component C subunit beta [Chloroflexota bacterium]